MTSFTLKIETTNRMIGAVKLQDRHFHGRSEKPGKGRGSYQRRDKHRGRDQG